jgi:hypothetical protein
MEKLIEVNRRLQLPLSLLILFAGLRGELLRRGAAVV